jgi:hypothetical protein
MKIDEIELESIKDYAKQNSLSASDVFRKGGLMILSGVTEVDLKELESLRVRIIELEDENVSLRDTLESNSGAVSHLTLTGREVPNYGLPTKELNQSLANIHYRLARVPLGSASHFAKLCNMWSSRVLRVGDRTFTPVVPSKEIMDGLEKGK